jgi:ATP-dependent DNA helicase RecQ
VEQAIAVMTEFKRLAALAPDWQWDRCAVIAREWKFLEPVRAWCELHAIPVQMADEDGIPLWRLRETQALVYWARSRQSKLISPASLHEWLDMQVAGPGWSLLRQAIEGYELEIAAAELPTDHFFEWLAEWGRDLRRKQSGLLLLTAHRAKGLEFAHVAVLDGAWEKTQKSEDADAARRLYYVAMTRAQQTLLLARQNAGNPLLNALPESPSTLHRPDTDLPAAQPEMNRNYLRLSLKDIDLSCAGRYQKTKPVHQAIAEATPGDPLLLKKTAYAWELTNLTGQSLCRLAKAFSPPAGKRFVSAKVLAVIVRQREDSEPEYHDKIRSDCWEVVVPELIYG